MRVDGEIDRGAEDGSTGDLMAEEPIAVEDRDAVVEFFDTARMIGAGEMHFGDDPGMDLKVKVSDVDVDNIVTPDWKQRVSGMLSGDVHITGRPGDPDDVGSAVVFLASEASALVTGSSFLIDGGWPAG